MSQDNQNQAVNETMVKEPTSVATPQAKATSESIKEAARWVLSFVVAQILVSVADMVHLLPKELPIYFQSGMEPIVVLHAQAAARMVLTVVTRSLDKYIHIKGKTEATRGEPQAKKQYGLFWF